MNREEKKNIIDDLSVKLKEGLLNGLREGYNKVITGLEKGALNMMPNNAAE